MSNSYSISKTINQSNSEKLNISLNEHDEETSPTKSTVDSSLNINDSTEHIELKDLSSSLYFSINDSVEDRNIILGFYKEPIKESEENNEHKENKFKGAIYFMISCLLLTTSIFLSKIISIKYRYISSFTQNMYRSIPPILISYYFMRKHDAISTFRSLYIKLIIRSFTNFVNISSLTLSSYFLKVTTSTTISSLTPIVTSVMAVAFLKETMTKTNIICLFISFIGCLILAKPFSHEGSSEEYGNNDHFIGYLFAFIYLFSRSTAIILQKTLSSKIDTQLIIFLINLLGLILSFLVCIFFYGMSSLKVGINEFGLLMISGIVIYLGNFFTMISIREAKIVFLQMLFPSIILFGFIVSVVFFKDTHDYSDYIGACIVFLINIYNSYDAYVEYKKKKNEN